MSASREKKQRTDGVGDLTPRQLRDLKETQAKKRNKVLYTFFGAVLAILVIALLVWNSGMFQKKQVAATVNGQEFTVAQISYYYGNVRQQEMQMASMYQQFGMAYYDSAAPAKSQVQDAETGATYADYFQTQTLDYLKQVVILCDQANEQGYVLSDEGKAGVDAQIDTMKQYAAQQSVSLPVYLKSMFGKYMTESLFREEALRNALASEYSTQKSDGFTYADDLLDTYYNENTAAMDTYEYYYAQISGAAETTVDAEGKTVEATDEAKTAAMNEAKKQADAMAAEIEAGADFAATAVKYVSETDKAAYEADPEYRHQIGDLGSNLTASSYGQWLTSTDTSRKAGDIGVVEDTANSSYYVVSLVNRWLSDDTYATVDTRSVFIKAAMDDGATEPTEAQYEAAKARVEEIKAEWESGPKTADTFAQIATLYSEDDATKTEGGLATGVTRGTNGAEFSDFAFAAGRKVGDVGVAKSTQTDKQGYYLVYMDALGELVWKNTAETALRTNDYNTWYDGIAETYEAVAAAGMSHLIK